MTAAIAIDTLAAMRKLERAGFKTDQAEAVAEVIAYTGENLVTKENLEVVEKSLRQEIAGVRQEVKASEKSLRQELAVLRWMFGLHFGITLIVLGFVVAVALRVFEALPK